MKRALIAVIVAAAWAVGPAGAADVADVPLAHVLAVVARNPGLRTSIQLRLWQARLARSDVVCRAQRFDARWTQLAGAGIGPYECPIGQRTVFITATQTYYDGEGRKLRATDPALALRAARVTETNFKWQWRQAK